MSVKKTLTNTLLATALISATGFAHAEGQLRGGMTAIHNVASAIATQNGYSNFKWVEGSRDSGPVVNRASRASSNTYKWASHPSATGAQTAGIEVSADAEQTRHRWGLRNDADQSRHRWGLRNDADQARHRWGLR